MAETLDVSFTKVTSEEQGAKMMSRRKNREAVGYTSFSWSRHQDNKVQL